MVTEWHWMVTEWSLKCTCHSVDWMVTERWLNGAFQFSRNGGVSSCAKARVQIVYRVDMGSPTGPTGFPWINTGTECMSTNSCDKTCKNTASILEFWMIRKQMGQKFFTSFAEFKVSAFELVIFVTIWIESKYISFRSRVVVRVGRRYLPITIVPPFPRLSFLSNKNEKNGPLSKSPGLLREKLNFIM